MKEARLLEIVVTNVSEVGYDYAPIGRKEASSRIQIWDEVLRCEKSKMAMSECRQP